MMRSMLEDSHTRRMSENLLRLASRVPESRRRMKYITSRIATLKTRWRKQLSHSRAPEYSKNLLSEFLYIQANNWLARKQYDQLKMLDFVTNEFSITLLCTNPYRKLN